ncbi:MAG: hypothetical protein HYX81_00685 [Chloroflexi bacterium]|nr:hypothetical protein [Chloroflexota bacterium]
MFRIFVFGFLQQVKSPVEAERWYVRFHTQEVLRNWGPWMARYETYRTFEPPVESKRFGAVGAFYTEHWWRSIEDYDEARACSNPTTPVTASLTEPPLPATPLVQVMTPARPTENFLDKKPPAPEEMPIIRWLRAFKYPEGVSAQEGDKWYLQTYSQQVKQQAGLLKYVCYTCVPGASMHRVEELWYRDLDAWRKAVVESPPSYTPPSWAKKEEPFVDMTSTFVRLKPTWDWFRERPFSP